MREWKIEYEAKVWTVNQARQMHFRTEAPLVAEWRRAFKLLTLAQKVPKLDKIAVTAQPFLKYKRSQDVGACFHAVKAALDGISDAVLKDDSPEYVVSLAFLPPVLSAVKDSLVMTITEVD